MKINQINLTKTAMRSSRDRWSSDIIICIFPLNLERARRCFLCGWQHPVFTAVY